MSKSEILAAIEELHTTISSLQPSIYANLQATNSFPLSPTTAPDFCWCPSPSPPPITPAHSPILHTTNSISLLPIRRLSRSEIEAKNDLGLCYNCDQTWSDIHRCRSKYLIIFGTDDEDDFGDPKSPYFMAGVEAAVEDVSSPSPFSTTHSPSPIFSPSAPSTTTDMPFIDAPPHLPSKAIPPHSILHSPTPLPSIVLQPPPPPPTEPSLDLLPSPAIPPPPPITPSVSPPPIPILADGNAVKTLNNLNLSTASKPFPLISIYLRRARVYRDSLRPLFEIHSWPRSENKKPSPTVIFGSKTSGPKGLIAAVGSPSAQENDRGLGSPLWLLVGPEDEEVLLCSEPPPDLLGITSRFHSEPYQFLSFARIFLCRFSDGTFVEHMVNDELVEAIKDAEEGLFRLERARLIREADCVLKGLVSSGNVKVEPLEPTDVEPEPLVDQTYSVGTKCRFRHTDGRWYNGLIVGLEESDLSSAQSGSSDDEDDSPQGLGFLEGTALQRGVQTDIAIFATWENHTRGIASKMMANMGYREGIGLGASGQGRLDPNSVKVLPPKQSLDHTVKALDKDENKDARAKKRSRGGTRKRDKKLAAAAKAAEEEEDCKDVFSLINTQLAMHRQIGNGSSSAKRQQQNKANGEATKEDRRAIFIATLFCYVFAISRPNHLQYSHRHFSQLHLENKVIVKEWGMIRPTQSPSLALLSSSPLAH